MTTSTRGHITSEIDADRARLDLDARDRLVRLQEVTAALSAAATLEEVGKVATELGARAVDAVEGSLWLRSSDGSPALHARTGGQLARETADAAPEWPITRALESGTTVWMESTAAQAQGPMAIVPLKAQGRVLGVLALGFDGSRRLGDADRIFVETVVAQCGQAFDRARLLAEAREHERAERGAREQAMAAMRIRDEFLATVSHELRTPLNAILGWIQLLRTGTVPAARHEHALAVIERNAHIQEQLVADLLDVSRVITGRLRLNVVDVRLQEVVDMAVEVIRPSTTDKKIRVEVDLDANAPAVLGDFDRLQQVVWNLLTNAVKFTPQGGTISIRVATETPHVVVTVSDTGKGMAPEFLECVFQPFRQADSSFARRQKGLGLGLAITRSLIEMHAGTVEAHSEGDGKGATFVVRMPIATLRPEATPRVPAFSPRTEPQRSRAPADALRDLMVLVVEDEPDSRELMVSLLEQKGAKVLAAASAAEALEKFTLATPQVLLSDVGLPGEDGLSLIRKVRALPNGALPAIALTAFVSDADRRRAIEAGFDDHVAKPIDPDALIRALLALVANHASQRSSPS